MVETCGKKNVSERCKLVIRFFRGYRPSLLGSLASAEEQVRQNLVGLKYGRR